MTTRNIVLYAKLEPNRQGLTDVETLVGSDTSPQTPRVVRPSSLIIFDGDDTLWKTQELYDKVKAQFSSLMAHQGFSGADALEMLDRIDAEAVDVRAFTVGRFIDSMLQTYSVLSNAVSREPQEQIEARIRRLSKALLGEYQLYPDALTSLEGLAPHFQLILATKGEPDLQRQKVRQLGLVRIFDQIYLMERKTEKEYILILSAQQADPERAWVVGNSIRSDINPALTLGIRSILIKRPTWVYEEAQLQPGDVAIVDSISAACKVIRASESRRCQHGDPL